MTPSANVSVVEARLKITYRAFWRSIDRRLNLGITPIRHRSRRADRNRSTNNPCSQRFNPHHALSAALIRSPFQDHECGHLQISEKRGRWKERGIAGLKTQRHTHDPFLKRIDSLSKDLQVDSARAYVLITVTTKLSAAGAVLPLRVCFWYSYWIVKCPLSRLLKNGATASGTGFGQRSTLAGTIRGPVRRR